MIYINTQIFHFIQFQKKNFKEPFPSGLIIYRTKGHCWNTPTPCIGNLSSKIFVNKLKGYYFIYK